MEYIAPYASFVYKMALGNLWLFRGIVSNVSRIFTVTVSRVFMLIMGPILDSRRR